MSSITNPSKLAYLADLKQRIITSDHARLVVSWADLISELKVTTDLIKTKGNAIVPDIQFAQIDELTKEDIDNIKKRGCVVIRNVVDTAQANKWMNDLYKLVAENPVKGEPADAKQYYLLHWSKAQVEARSHANVIKATVWLNSFYHLPPHFPSASQLYSSVDLNTTLTYADRIRITQPGKAWNGLPPHIDGGGIERWDDPSFRSCFKEILAGEWRKHDPYDISGRVNAQLNVGKYPVEASIFRTFQGWLSLTETDAHEGTLRILPDVKLATAYVILRPFFRLKAPDLDVTDAKNWELDLSSPDFPGLQPREDGVGFSRPFPNTESHPNLALEGTVLTIPKVNPGDMVFWHCDVIHAVETEHKGHTDSAVIFIPAVPVTAHNLQYVEKQKTAFLNCSPPPDFPGASDEATFTGMAKPDDILTEAGKRAMRLVY